MGKLKLTPAPGGWVHADWEDGNAWLRFNCRRWDGLAMELTTVAEIRIPNPTQAVLRHIPLKRIEAAVTVRGGGSDDWGSGRDGTDDWVSGLMLARYDRKPPQGLLDGPPGAGLTKQVSKRYKLKRPAGRRLERDFYREVAHAYQSAVANGENPRKALASDTGSADPTVAAWIQEARRLKFLPKAQPGKVSA